MLRLMVNAVVEEIELRMLSRRLTELGLEWSATKHITLIRAKNIAAVQRQNLELRVNPATGVCEFENGVLRLFNCVVDNAIGLPVRIIGGEKELASFVVAGSSIRQTFEGTRTTELTSVWYRIGNRD